MPRSQTSKEFQAKLKVQDQLWSGLAPGVGDCLLFDVFKTKLLDLFCEFKALDRDSVQIEPHQWRREGLRFDTAAGRLRHNNITLAVEATDVSTKLKVKAHHLVPELLYKRPEASPCYIDMRRVPRANGGAHFKIEQDIHFDHTKSCASGSLFLEGRHTSVSNLAFFSRFFPNLEALSPPDTVLLPVSRWDECVFDGFSLPWSDKVTLGGWMMVNRWDWGTNTLLESEISFKVCKPLKADWSWRHLKAADTLYLALSNCGLFEQAPPIFVYNDPVMSQAIRYMAR